MKEERIFYIIKWIALFTLAIALGTLLTSCEKETDLIAEPVGVVTIEQEIALPDSGLDQGCVVTRVGRDWNGDGVLDYDEIDFVTSRCRKGSYDYLEDVSELPGTQCLKHEGGLDFNGDGQLGKFEKYDLLIYLTCN